MLHELSFAPETIDTAWSVIFDAYQDHASQGILAFAVLTTLVLKVVNTFLHCIECLARQNDDPDLIRGGSSGEYHK